MQHNKFIEILKNKDWKKGAELVFALGGVPKGMSLPEMKAEIMKL